MIPKILPKERDRSCMLKSDPWEGCTDLVNESLIDWLIGALNALRELSPDEKRLLLNRNVMQELVCDGWASTDSVESKFLRHWCWRTLGARTAAFPSAAKAVAAGLAPKKEDENSSAWWTGFVQGVAAASVAARHSEAKPEMRPSTCSTASTVAAMDGRLSEASASVAEEGNLDDLVVRGDAGVSRCFSSTEPKVTCFNSLPVPGSMQPEKQGVFRSVSLDAADAKSPSGQRQEVQSMFAHSCVRTAASKWLSQSATSKARQARVEQVIQGLASGSQGISVHPNSAQGMNNSAPAERSTHCSTSR